MQSARQLALLLRGQGLPVGPMQEQRVGRARNGLDVRTLDAEPCDRPRHMVLVEGLRKADQRVGGRHRVEGLLDLVPLRGAERRHLLDPEDELTRLALDRDHVGTLVAEVLEGVADIATRDVLLELELQLRAALEVDPPVRPRPEDRKNGEHDQRNGSGDDPLPHAHEVDVGTGLHDLHGVIRSSGVARARLARASRT